MFVFHFLNPPGGGFSGQIARKNDFQSKPEECKTGNRIKRLPRKESKVHLTLAVYCTRFFNGCQGKCKVFSCFMGVGVSAPVGPTPFSLAKRRQRKGGKVTEGNPFREKRLFLAELVWLASLAATHTAARGVTGRRSPARPYSRVRSTGPAAFIP